MNRDTGIRTIIPGVRFDNEIREDLRSQRAIRNRLEGMKTPEPVQPDLRFAPTVDLKPTKILHKEGEYGHPNYWKSEKEYEKHLISSPSKKQHNKAFNMGNGILKASEAEKNKMADEYMRGGGRDPNGRSLDQEIKLGKDTWLKNQRPSPQYGVKPINSHEKSTYAYNQKEALATADAMDQAVANTKTRINQIHKNPASKIIEKEQSIKDLQRITDIAFEHSNDQWAHKPKWELDRKTGSPIDVADPINQNAKTVRQLQELKSWSQGGKVNAPHVKLHSAGTKLRAARKKDADKKLIKWALEESPVPIVKNPVMKKAIAADNDPAAGAKYIDWWDRIETKN